jgi:hypothetical protein
VTPHAMKRANEMEMLRMVDLASYKVEVEERDSL